MMLQSIAEDRAPVPLLLTLHRANKVNEGERVEIHCIIFGKFLEYVLHNTKFNLPPPETKNADYHKKPS